MQKISDKMLLKVNNIKELTKFPAHKIIEWTIRDEIKDFDYILEFLKINPKDNNYDFDILRDDWYSNISSGIKVGGTPTFTQYADTEMREKYNFLQISERNILPYAWGDCGIAHVTEDCELYWDCC
jgi:uncharacterized protein YwqG